MYRFEAGESQSQPWGGSQADPGGGGTGSGSALPARAHGGYAAYMESMPPPSGRYAGGYRPSQSQASAPYPAWRGSQSLPPPSGWAEPPFDTRLVSPPSHSPHFAASYASQPPLAPVQRTLVAGGSGGTRPPGTPTPPQPSASGSAAAAAAAATATAFKQLNDESLVSARLASIEERCEQMQSSFSSLTQTLRIMTAVREEDSSGHAALSELLASVQRAVAVIAQHVPLSAAPPPPQEETSAPAAAPAAAPVAAAHSPPGKRRRGVPSPILAFDEAEEEAAGGFAAKDAPAPPPAPPPPQSFVAFPAVRACVPVWAVLMAAAAEEEEADAFDVLDEGKDKGKEVQSGFKPPPAVPPQWAPPAGRATGYATTLGGKVATEAPEGVWYTARRGR